MSRAIVHSGDPKQTPSTLRKAVLFGCALRFQECRLARYSPAVAGKGSVTAHDTVTGDDDRQMICRACLCDRADRFGFSDAPGDVRVGCCFSARNLFKSIPDFSLKSCTADVQWERKMRVGILYQRCDGSGECLGLIISDEFSLWETILEIAQESFWIVTEGDGAVAALRGCD